MFTFPTMHFAGGVGGNDADTILLLHMDGADGSTTFTDDSASTHSVTVFSGTDIDTSQSKFGGASGRFNGSTSYLQVADSADWDIGTGDFTVDCWVRFDDLGTRRHFLYDFVGTKIRLELTALDDWDVYIAGAQVLSAASSLTANTWYHVALVRSGTTVTLYVDGVAVGTGTSGGNVSGVQHINIGMHAGLRFMGYMDEFRVSNVARWDAAFTPPNGPYS